MRTAPTKDRNGDIYVRTTFDKIKLVSGLTLFFFVLCPLYTSALCLGIACFLLSFVFGWMYLFAGSLFFLLFLAMKIWLFSGDQDYVSLLIGVMVISMYTVIGKHFHLF